jgi:diaminopimelate decarboxylase
MIRTLAPKDWGLTTGPAGGLHLGGIRATDLARSFGTPLHVLDERRLEATAVRFRQGAAEAYSGRTSVHYAFKCNSVPAVLRTVRGAGLKAEVMSALELDLALSLGFEGRDIIVNGPCKTDEFLKACLACGARLVNVDSLEGLLLSTGSPEPRSARPTSCSASTPIMSRGA